MSIEEKNDLIDKIVEDIEALVSDAIKKLQNAIVSRLRLAQKAVSTTREE